MRLCWFLQYVTHCILNDSGTRMTGSTRNRFWPNTSFPRTEFSGSETRSRRWRSPPRVPSIKHRARRHRVRRGRPSWYTDRSRRARFEDAVFPVPWHGLGFDWPGPVKNVPGALKKWPYRKNWACLQIDCAPLFKIWNGTTGSCWWGDITTIGPECREYSTDKVRCFLTKRPKKKKNWHRNEKRLGEYFLKSKKYTKERWKLFLTNWTDERNNY